MNRWIIFCNFLVVLSLLLLPYILFDGKLYIGGDDTRLMYAYPLDYLTNATLYSWYHFSSLGWNSPPQAFFPFMVAWTGLGFVVKSSSSLSYLAFSLPLILGFLFFQKFIEELFFEKENNSKEAFVGSLFFILSPILASTQLFIFLTNAWLTGLIPIVLYFFIRYLKTFNPIYILCAILFSSFISLVSLAVPWILGFSFPLLIGLLIACSLFKKNEIIFFIKRFCVFFGILFLSQAYWIISFLMTYINLKSSSFAAKVVSKGFIDTFSPTVESSAVSSIIFPLLNLPHRQIAFNFEWDLKNIFLSFYDKTFFLNSIFILVLFFGVLNYKKILNVIERKIFSAFLVTFVFSLFLVTVNIGPLKELFLLMGKLPGFLIFRNFYDKFSFGYVFFYAILITFSLVILRRKIRSERKYFALLACFLMIIVINTIPFSNIINAPLWTTSSTHKNINIPDEYLGTMKFIKNNISPTNNILSLPFGSSAYTVIKDEKSNDVFVGTSPVVVFSGVNDISGHFSFNFTKTANDVDKTIVDRNYNKLREILFKHNINYVLLTKNVPNEVKRSYVFNEDMIANQDSKFVSELTGKKIYTSTKANYEIYSTVAQNVLVKSENLYIQRVNPVKFRLYIKGISEKQLLDFNDSFHDGWKLFIQKNPDLGFCKNPKEIKPFKTKECLYSQRVFDFEDLVYFFTQPVFEETHKNIDDFSNEWTIDPRLIKNSFSTDYHKENADGTLDVELILYFTPQFYFYLGIAVSVATFVFFSVYLFRRRQK